MTVLPHVSRNIFDLIPVVLLLFFE